MPLPYFRLVLKKEFLKNAHLTDIRVIDRKVNECEQHLCSLKYYFYNEEHLRNYLFREDVDEKPKDFMTKFCSIMHIARRNIGHCGSWIYKCGIRWHFGKGLALRGLATYIKSSVDPQEIERFGELSSEWLDEKSSFKALYSYNKLRVPWIVDALSSEEFGEASFYEVKYPLRGKRILDVACGGGILAVPLARLGASVSAIDASQEVICCAEYAARRYSRNSQDIGSLEVEYATVEDYASKYPGSFDAVVASEVIEHVKDLEGFVRSCAVLAHPGSPLFFTTLNKTVLSRVLGVFIAEEILKITSSGVHDWSKFVTPCTLRALLEDNNCEVRLAHGVRYNPFKNEWFWSSSFAINYAVMAVKL
ncbi:unnamed protein product [Enterobius vermicularis]|uniref:Ubiquinone biosynthesis O-methyltransferase, mitochondrial n=1 Tax=Enterobius vermicularis TaxID=51028 RepID=A0A0N4V069_ENTVE|nr:unnamed protein product [Enterobius vermicularis]